MSRSPISSDELDPPSGFTLASARGPFTQHNGPLYVAEAPPQGQTVMGLRVLERHCNGLGFFHGGMACAFSDGLMAHAAWAAERRSSVTLKISVEYFDIVRRGDWLEGSAWCVSSDGEVAQIACELSVESRVRARGRASFRLLRR
ncbi:MAG: PaaI family thioesterase [Pseudomonadota bacterium]